MTWIVFVLLTVACWGLYGIYLHKGSVLMADPSLGRYKAFLLVGLAYFVTAVLLPAVLIAMKGGSIAFWKYPAGGMGWSFFAGILGAIGAFGVLLALGAFMSANPDNKGLAPIVVMSLVFAFAPVVNAVVALIMHPPEGGWGMIRPQFYLGILLAAIGGYMVTVYKTPKKPDAPTAPSVVEAKAE